MPATVTTSCWPIASTSRIAADTSRSLMLPTVRKLGVAMKNAMNTATSPIGAANRAAEASERCPPRPRRGALRSTMLSSLPGGHDRVGEGHERLWEGGDRLVHVAGVDQLDWCHDPGWHRL